MNGFNARTTNSNAGMVHASQTLGIAVTGNQDVLLMLQSDVTTLETV